jgi:hypothetical protein
MVQYQNTTLLFHNFGEDAQNSLLVSSEDEPGVSLHSMFTHPLRTLWSSLANQATAVAQEVAWLCKVISVGLCLLDAQTSRGMPGQDEPGSNLQFSHGQIMGYALRGGFRQTERLRAKALGAW